MELSLVVVATHEALWQAVCWTLCGIGTGLLLAVAVQVLVYGERPGWVVSR